MTSYLALPLQITCHAVNATNSVKAARESILRSIEGCGKLIAGSIGFSNSYFPENVRLVVLPEYFLTGFPMGESTEVWQEKACLSIDGPEYALLGAIAVQHQLYISGNVYELDHHFPELYFQSSFIVDPQGEVILRYRRLNSMFSPTPHDLLDKYLETYGEQALFPVVDTEIGKLACIASEEILFPEIARALMLEGAEVFCHSSSEMGSALATPKNIAKRARAFENMAYVVSANSAGIADIEFPTHSTDGHSQVVDFHGTVLAEAKTGESTVGAAPVSLNELRHARRTPSMTNSIARQRLELFKRTYSRSIYEANNLVQDGELAQPSRQHFIKTQQNAIKNLGL